jgi:hypothetical protein
MGFYWLYQCAGFYKLSIWYAGPWMCTVEGFLDKSKLYKIYVNGGPRLSRVLGYEESSSMPSSRRCYYITADPETQIPNTPKRNLIL